MNLLRLIRWTALLGLALALLLAPARAADVSAAGGFHVGGRYILDANGKRFVMRGINHPYTWFPDETAAFAHIKAKGANTVRVVLSSGQLWPANSAADVQDVIDLCIASRLVCVLEVHDTTGYGDPGVTAAPLSAAVAYWKSIQGTLAGHEAHVIVNIGNEPFGNTDTITWVDATKSAIAELRAAGFQHMLMVDAPNWGQDHEHVMRDHAAEVFASDPLANTVFSVHMYGVYESASAIQGYLQAFVSAGLPLVIGEFGPVHGTSDPDEDAVMAYAEQYEVGYLGWSWSGNCCGGEALDMVTEFDPARETAWGARIVRGPDGLLATSCEASVFGGTCFADVTPAHWAAAFVQRLYEAGITGGCGTVPLRYCPEGTVTRGQMAVFLLRGIHGPGYAPPDVGPGTGFGDVPATYWSAAFIKQLAAEGITAGCGSGDYCPQAPVSRAQMAVFLLRSKYGAAYTPPAVGVGTGFGDVPPGHWAAPFIKQLVAEGITAGCGNGNYCPESPVTRAQMAVFLVRTFSLP